MATTIQAATGIIAGLSLTLLGAHAVSGAPAGPGLAALQAAARAWRAAPSYQETSSLQFLTTTWDAGLGKTVVANAYATVRTIVLRGAQGWETYTRAVVTAGPAAVRGTQKEQMETATTTCTRAGSAATWSCRGRGHNPDPAAITFDPAALGGPPAPRTFALAVAQWHAIGLRRCGSTPCLGYRTTTGNPRDNVLMTTLWIARATHYPLSLRVDEGPGPGDVFQSQSSVFSRWNDPALARDVPVLSSLHHP